MPNSETQNIDDDIQDMLEYYHETETNTLEMEMLDHGVSWSDFF